MTDADGRRWTVWAVVPEFAERRRRTPPDGVVAIERRRVAAYRVPLGPEWADGWLCFESNGEKWRLPNYPCDWYDLPDSRLLALKADAEHGTVAKRRLIE